jgi:hypothetical protein
VKGQWQIIGSEFGDKKDTITGGSLDRKKYDLKSKK